LRDGVSRAQKQAAKAGGVKEKSRTDFSARLFAVSVA
jgi:hypothetical protein